MVKITALYVGLYLIVLTYLMLRTILKRVSTRVSILDGGNTEMTSAIRIHGNFVETSVFVLIGIMISEMRGIDSVIIHAWGVLYLVGRVLHFYGLRKTLEESIGRKIGTIITLLILLTQGTILSYDALLNI